MILFYLVCLFYFQFAWQGNQSLFLVSHYLFSDTLCTGERMRINTHFVKGSTVLHPKHDAWEMHGPSQSYAWTGAPAVCNQQQQYLLSTPS